MLVLLKLLTLQARANNYRKLISCVMNLADKQSWLLSRTNACPINLGVEECPIKVLRSKPMDKRQRLITNMRREALDSWLEKYLKCSGEWDTKGRKI